jgi:Glyoxalase-like domain
MAIHGAATGLDHVGIVAPVLDDLARAFEALGFALTPEAKHASGRTANRCAMFRDGGYLELMATVPGQASATLDRFLAKGPGAHILALAIDEEAAAQARLARAGLPADRAITARAAGPAGEEARFGLLMPPDPPEGRVLLIHHLTPDLLWRPEVTRHPNGALALREVVFAAASPALTMTTLARVSGRPAEPDPAGGYRIPLPRACIRVLTREAAATLFGGPVGAAPIAGLVIAADGGDGRVARAGGVAIRLIGAA